VSFPHSLYTKLNTQDSRHSPLVSLAHEIGNDGLRGARPNVLMVMLSDLGFSARDLVVRQAHNAATEPSPLIVVQEN
ncbi:hypothetical protein HNQ96_006067, partial [Aminobacter lissarensis]